MSLHPPRDVPHYDYKLKADVRGYLSVYAVSATAIGDLGHIGVTWDHEWKLIGSGMVDRPAVFTTREKAAAELEYRHFHNLRLFSDGES
jgi:hypothetical protein